MHDVVEIHCQDIRDLVELTVGKMEMYHLVAALFMESSMALCLGFCRQQVSNVPLKLVETFCHGNVEQLSYCFDLGQAGWLPSRGKGIYARI